MTERRITGEGYLYRGDCDNTCVNDNYIYIASPQGGQGLHILELELLETIRKKNRTLIIVCTSRKIPDMFIPMFKSADINTYDMNFADIMSADCMYDPLFYVSSEENAESMARSIIIDNRQKKYAAEAPLEEAVQLLTAYALEVLMLNQENSPHATLTDVVDLNNNMIIDDYTHGIVTSLDPVFDVLKKERPGCYALKCWRSFREAAPATARSIFITLSSALSIFTPDICDAIQHKPNIDFKKISSEPSAIFITTSSVDKAHDSIANMFISQCIKSLFEIAEEQPGGVLSLPVHIAFENFESGAKTLNFPEQISFLSDKGISCTLVLKSEAQLEKLYGHYGATEIRDCCDNYVYMGSNNIETARSVSERLDVPLSDVLYMSLGQKIVFRRGQLPVITQRYNIQDDPLYQKAQKLYDKRKKGCAR